jgi:hypothetical protein
VLRPCCSPSLSRQQAHVDSAVWSSRWYIFSASCLNQSSRLPTKSAQAHSRLCSSVAQIMVSFVFGDSMKSEHSFTAALALALQSASTLRDARSGTRAHILQASDQDSYASPRSAALGAAALRDPQCMVPVRSPAVLPASDVL